MSLKQPVSMDDCPEFTLPNYVYRARVVDLSNDIVDGDTVDVLLDLGFNISVTKRLRFLLVDT